MKTSLRLALPAVTLLTLAQIVCAQTTPPTTEPGRPQTPVGPVGSDTSVAIPPTFRDASPAVQTSVVNAIGTADAVRAASIGVATTPVPRPTTLTTAVTTANNAIVAESATTRATALTQRQASLARLRVAASEAERQRLVDDLRVQSGQRLEEQREAARLVRDRIRVLRDLTTVNRPATP
jgi:hypothetical protein